MVLLKDSFSQRYSNFKFNFFYSTQCLVSAKSDSVQFMSTRSPTLCRISHQGVRLREVLVSAKSHTYFANISANLSAKPFSLFSVYQGPGGFSS